MLIQPAAIRLSELQTLSDVMDHKDNVRRTNYKKLIPNLELTKDRCVKKIETFGDYVVQQLGLKVDNTCHWLSKFADDYLVNRNSSDGGQENIFVHLTGLLSEDEIESLYVELLREFEACMLSYFSFHWDHSSHIIDQVLQGSPQPRKKLRNVVLSATRKHRIERAMKTLRTKNVFSTLIEQLKAIGSYTPLHEPNNIVEPANANMGSPVLLLVGGGMGAGKSSVVKVVKDVMKCPFWSHAGKNAVVVEADAFKDTDSIYQALSSNGYREMLETAQLVHKASTDAASSLLVTALNEGRNIIFDGTMSWKSFVQQTIAMVRDVHRRRYRRGPGYHVDSNGVEHEKYWEVVEEYDSVSDGESLKQGMMEGPLSGKASDTQEPVLESGQSRKPYKIELIGVICDAPLAVARGMRRAILTRRAVDIRKQLISHKMFADAFSHYCELVDRAMLYCTNKIGNPAERVGLKEYNGKLQLCPEGISVLRNLSILNPNARSALELYNTHNDGNELDQGWIDIVLSPQRCSQQQNLQIKIQRVQSLLSVQRSAASTSSDISVSSHLNRKTQ